MQNDATFSIVLVSNGPGEVATWVHPLTTCLHHRLRLRPQYPRSPLDIRLVLVPCPNATGHEARLASSWNLFERVLPARKFWTLLLSPRRYSSWPRRGMVVFLGGDQLWSVLLSARLGYRHLTYAEWVARWPCWNDKIAAMSTSVRNRLPQRLRNRCAVVGDLMADISGESRRTEPLPSGDWVALLPGSKRSKLSVGVPFLLETADHLIVSRPSCHFLLPVAPTTSLEELQHYASRDNPIASHYSSGVTAVIAPPPYLPDCRRIITNAGTVIHLQESPPAYRQVSQCQLALTTVGANTAELGALGVPMIVIIPTQHLMVMESWDGWAGVLARLPGLRHLVGSLLSAWRLHYCGMLAWPNINAGRLVVPECVGVITPTEIADEAIHWLESPGRLADVRINLRTLRGETGAVSTLASEIYTLLLHSIVNS
ncbi:glycosyl transferase [cyanobiont of Ornithocercus magnificus]|nr:glycosyl transferase [cyanobiont of Ornithocercus magnificus]